MPQIRPTPAQVAAAHAAVRKMLDDYSGFYSSMVSDDVLENVCSTALTAALNVAPTTKEQSK